MKKRGRPRPFFARLRRLAGATAIALALLLGSGQPAAAAPLVPVIIGIATFLATPVGQIVLAVALHLISSKIARAKAKKSHQQEAILRTTLTVGGNRPLSFPCGLIGIAGQRAYAGSWGAEGGTPNAYGVDVIKLADYPITSLEGVQVFGQDCTIDWEATPVDQGYPVLEYRDDAGTDHLWAIFHDGTQTEADAYLVDRFGEHEDRPWTSTAAGFGRAYVIYTWRANSKLFPRWPEMLSVVKGIKCYDRTKDTTAGGSGSHRRADPSTWEWTGNLIAIADTIVFAGLSHSGEWLWGLQNFSAARLPASAWIAAINECDVDMDLAEGGAEKQFHGGFEVLVNQEPRDILEEIAKSVSGRFTESGGIYKPLAGAPGSAVLAITDDNIVITRTRGFEPFPPIKSISNAAVPKFTDPAKAWELKPAPEYINATALAEDGEKLSADLSFPMITSNTRAQRVTKYAVDDGRRWRKHSVYLPPIAAQMECIDVLAWTSTEYGYDDKKFIFDYIEELHDGDVFAVFTELDPSDIDWNPETDEQTHSAGSLTPSYPPAQVVTGWQAFPHSESGKPLIKLTGPGDLDDVDQVVFTVRNDADQGVVGSWTASYGEPGAAASTRTFVINGTFARNSAYEVQVDIVPGSARDTEPSAWLDVTTPDLGTGFDDLDETMQYLEGRVANLLELPAQLAALRQQVDDLDLSTWSHVDQVTRDLHAGNEAVTLNYREEITAAYNDQNDAISLLVSKTETLEGALNGYLGFNAVGTSFSQQLVYIEANEDGISGLVYDLNLVELDIIDIDEEITAHGGVLTEHGTSIDTLDGNYSILAGDLTDVLATLTGFNDVDTVAEAIDYNFGLIDANGDDIVANAGKIQTAYAAMGGNSSQINVVWNAYAGTGGYEAIYAVQLAVDDGLYRAASMYGYVPSDDAEPTLWAFDSGQFAILIGGVPTLLMDNTGTFLRTDLLNIDGDVTIAPGFTLTVDHINSDALPAFDEATLGSDTSGPAAVATVTFSEACAGAVAGCYCSYTVGNTGGVWSATVTVYLQYRVDGGSWNNMTQESKSHSGSGDLVHDSIRVTDIKAISASSSVEFRIYAALTAGSGVATWTIKAGSKTSANIQKN